MTLSEIIERLEAATGADRKLDQEIATIHRREITGRPIIGVINCSPYTASTDAALTLVPEGLNWLLGKGRTRPDEPLYGAQVLDGAAVAGEGETDATLAIAICSAALRARSAP